MSEKIVQLNEEVIKGQLKELVRGSVRASNIGYTFGCLHEGLGKRFGCAAGASPRSGAVTSRPGTVQPPGSVTSCRGRVSRSCWTAAGSRPAGPCEILSVNVGLP